MEEHPHMTSDATSLALAIGQRVKQERAARGWTLDQLASAANVSRRLLVNVEQGDANPSVATLLKISDALGVGLPALVAPPAPRPITITRHGEGAALWTGSAGGRGVLVAGTAPPDVVELWDWTLGPGDHHASAAHTDGTRELAQILDGTIVITIGEDSFTLHPGDAITFPGDLPHAYTNRGDLPARFSLVVFEPGVGTPARPHPDST